MSTVFVFFYSVRVDRGWFIGRWLFVPEKTQKMSHECFFFRVEQINGDSGSFLKLLSA